MTNEEMNAPEAMGAQNCVVKRDGRTVSFDKHKVLVAVIKAINAVYGKSDKAEALKKRVMAEDIANKIEILSLETPLTVEEIQDEIISLLVDADPTVAKAYSEYRAWRTEQRENDSQFMKAVRKKALGQNVVNANANVDEKSFGGRINEASEMVQKKLAESIISPKFLAAHKENRSYIHDFGSYLAGMHNCLSVPFDKLLANGFSTRNMDIRPAGGVGTAMQLVAVIFQLQSLQQFGGVSATHIDHTMVPYVRKTFRKKYQMAYMKSSPEFLVLDILGMAARNTVDEAGVYRNALNDWMDERKDEFAEKLGLSDEDFRFDNKENLDPVLYQAAMFDTVNEVHQAVEALYHNLNTLQSRSGNQLPFTSINYGTCTEEEGRLVTRELLNVLIEGLGALHRTSIFPCGIFQYKKGINDKPGTPNYDLFRLALRATSQRLYPNYANCDWSGNKGYDENDVKTYFSTMGCRTANGWDINGMGQTKDGRGNICPMTIILPTLAMEAGRDVEKFMEILDEHITLTIDALRERFEWIASQSPASARFMWDNGTMEGYIPEEGIRSALKHGTLAVGQIGLAETLQLLIGKDHTTEEGMELAKRIEQLFKDRCAAAKEEYKLNYGVYFTPAENLCHTALEKFRDKYGVIPNVSDKEFFTNSMHVPVWHEMSPFEKIDIESQLTGYSSAGCITYVELDSSAKNNIDALEALVTYAMDKDIPYFAINVPNDTCLDCGYTDDMNDVCPICGGTNIQHLRRVTGYLTNDYKTAFNLGKQDEVRLRYKHSRTPDDRFNVVNYTD